MTNKLLVVLCTGAVAFGAAAETIALYTGEGCEAGQPVGTLVNKVNPGTYDGTARQGGSDSVGYGNMPTYVDTVSGNGVYSDSFCTQLVAKVPLAFDFSTTCGVESATGGYIDLANLANTLSGKKKFTFEFFWRGTGSTRSTALASMYYGIQLRASTSWEYQSTPTLEGNYGSSWRMPSIDGDWNIYLNTLGWRHWAVTYDADTKIAQIYFDYQPGGALTNGFANGSAKFPDFRLGARAENASTVSGFSRGQMTCFRVSDTILSTKEFLRMGTTVFYPFKDGAVGAAVSTVTNSLVPGTFTGVAGTLENLPKFDADRPGKYIFGSSARDRILAEDPQSIHLGVPNTWSQDKGWIAVSNMAGRLLTGFAESYTSSYTIECFFKKQHLSWGSLRLFSFNPNHAVWLLCQGASVGYMQQYQDTSATSFSNEDDSFLEDGLWHHLAVVFTRSSMGGNTHRNHKDVEIYVDYSKANGQKLGSCFYDPSKFCNTFTDRDFFIANDVTGPGTSTGFMGRMAAFRIVPYALTPAEFMVAGETTNAIPAGAGFRWRFEDGPDGSTVAQATDLVTGEKWATGQVRTFGPAAKTKPTFAADRLSKRLVTGDEQVTNRLSATFAAQTTTNRVYVETRTWNGLPVLHPKSWTLEALVKPDSATRTEDVLLVGRGRLNPSTGAQWNDFALVLQPDGRLGVKGRRIGESAAVDFATANLGTALANGAWHYVALTYDGETRQLGVWADGTKVLTTTLESDMVDSSMGRYQIGGGCGQGSFGGKIDEVRLTAGVKAEEDLQHPVWVAFHMIVQ